ncbi:MAG TPA: hypothetical protein VIN75_18975 [Burkholderiaceae bacterium]
MSVIVPYTRLHPAAAILLDRHAPGHVRVPLDPADMSAYWRLLAEQWHEPGDLLIVEHDVGIHADVVEGLTACPEPWCGHPYRIGSQLLVCLGCTRFSAALKASEPDLLDVVGEDGTGGLPARDWRRLDVRLLDELHRRGYRQHEHQPAVTHFHKYPGA